MDVEAQYEKGFCLMLTLFSHINAHIGSRAPFHSLNILWPADSVSRASWAHFSGRQTLDTWEFFLQRTALLLASSTFFPALLSAQLRVAAWVPTRHLFQKTGNAVRAIGRLSSMAMISGLSGRKSSTGSSPTSPLNAEKLESEGNGTRGRKDGLDWGERPFWVLWGFFNCILIIQHLGIKFRMVFGGCLDLIKFLSLGDSFLIFFSFLVGDYIQQCCIWELFLVVGP